MNQLSMSIAAQIASDKAIFNSLNSPKRAQEARTDVSLDPKPRNAKVNTRSTALSVAAQPLEPIELNVFPQLSPAAKPFFMPSSAQPPVAASAVPPVESWSTCSDSPNPPELSMLTLSAASVSN